MTISKFIKKLLLKYPALTDLRLIDDKKNNTIYIAAIEIDEKQRNKGYCHEKSYAGFD